MSEREEEKVFPVYVCCVVAGVASAARARTTGGHANIVRSVALSIVTVMLVKHLVWMCTASRGRFPDAVDLQISLPSTASATLSRCLLHLLLCVPLPFLLCFCSIHNTTK